jgi:uncharacterized protein YjbI with pentapeptide repeats
MKTIKPRRAGVLCRTFENGDASYLAVSVLVFFPFAPPSRPLTEVDLWRFAAVELGDEPIDACMPKQRGEVLVTGSAYPFGGPRPACAPRVTIGTVDKTLYVVGDRFWKGGAASDPRPFTEMPLGWEQAFGGEGYAPNPVGKGFAPTRTEHGEVHVLPNVEDPKRLVRFPDDRPQPAGFGPYDLTWPQRFSKVGTYDAAWLKERFPGFAKDMDWSLWNGAPEDQQIQGYFKGDEPFTLELMHPEKARIEGRLPGLRTRAVVTQRTGEGEAFREIATRLDTVRLFPHAERGVLVFHGLLEVAEDDGTDVVHLVLACEDMGAPKPVDHYREVLARRLDKKSGALPALRDGDLMPDRGGAAEAGSADAGTASVMATQGLLQKNMRRKAELEHERAKQRMAALGLDPGLVPPLPPEEPPPNLDDLATFVERMSAEADKAKADAEKRKLEAEEQARAACREQGIDYDRMMRDGQKGGGPPKFSAAEEIAKLRQAADRAKAQGLSDPEMDAALADGSLEECLRASEQRLREAYRRFAHHFPEAVRLEGDRGLDVRRQVAEGHRRGESFAGRDLTGADLSGLDLTRCDLRGALLERVDFTGAELGGADLTGAVLARADLTRANLFAAKLAGANLGSAKLVEAEVGGADLTGAVLAKADLTRARFHDAQMTRVDLSEAILAGADLARATASRVDLVGTDLTGVKLEGADMSKCTFVECTVAGVDFSCAKLVSAVFVAARGDGAIFRGADLENLRVVRDSSFERADFRGAKLVGANLRGTRLAGSDFSGARLADADLGEADLSGARLYRALA